MTIRIPYGRQSIDESDLAAVAGVLRSDWLTQGPKVEEFERGLAAAGGAKFAVAYANGTVALQGAYHAAGLKEGDEIITTPITFAATSTAALWQGAKPVFADIDPKDGNLDPAAAAAAVTPRTKVLAPVHFAGRPVDLDAFRSLAKQKNLLLIEDACHALGASYKGRPIGSIGNMSVFSFHPVKSITTGEGGAVLTDDPALHARLVSFRQHGIRRGDDWEYFVEEKASNSRLTDLQSALGSSQLKRLPAFVARRRRIAERYDAAFQGWKELELLPPAPESSWHLYVLRLRGEHGSKRRTLFQALRKRGIGVQVHYIPVYLHPYYKSLGYPAGLCPKAEDFYSRIISLPIYPDLTDALQDEVVRTVREELDRL